MILCNSGVDSFSFAIAINSRINVLPRGLRGGARPDQEEIRNFPGSLGQIFYHRTSNEYQIPSQKGMIIFASRRVG